MLKLKAKKNFIRYKKNYKTKAKKIIKTFFKLVKFKIIIRYAIFS